MIAAPLLPTYNRAPINLVSGDGCWVVDDTGKRYLDFLSGIAVCALGHSHPAIADAVALQARTLVHVSNLYHHEPAGTLARELVARSGLAGVFFCNSGTEANEAAIKLARKRAFRRGEKTRTTIIACTGSFHGRTLGALAATFNPAYKEGFGPLPGGFGFTRFNDTAALDAILNHDVAAFIVEPVQGESGVHVADTAFLKEARRLCDQRGALLIFDEIQCGSGRLGPLFAFQHFGVTPDALTMAKALGNGLPIGVLLASDQTADGLQPGDHGSTFGGSPIPCAAALAHLYLRDDSNLEQCVLERSIVLFAGLRDLRGRHEDIVDEPRGIGLLAGLPIRPPYDALTIAGLAREAGLLVGTAGGNTIRLAPPLVISDVDLERALNRLDSVLIAAQNAGRLAASSK